MTKSEARTFPTQRAVMKELKNMQTNNEPAKAVQGGEGDTLFIEKLNAEAARPSPSTMSWLSWTATRPPSALPWWRSAKWRPT